MTDDVRTVLIRPEHWERARLLWALHKYVHVADALNITEEHFNMLVGTVECGYCHAKPGQRCVTASGRRAALHDNRKLTLLAILNAVTDETVIQEEAELFD